MSSLASTMSSLSSITEDSTYGVEGEDVAPSVPRRRGSHGSSGVSKHVETLESIHEETRRSLHSTDEFGDTPKRSSSGSTNIRNLSAIHRSGITRRSQSNKSDSNASDAQHENESGRSGRTKKRPRIPQSSSQESSKNGAHEEETMMAISSRPTRRTASSSSRRRSSVGDSKEKTADASDRSEQNEKLNQTTRRRRSSRRSSASSLAASSISDKSSNQTIVEEIPRTSYSSGQHRRHRHSKSTRSSSRRPHSSNQASSVSSTSECSSRSDWTSSSRQPDPNGAVRQFLMSGSENDASGDSDNERPGAYRVSTHSTSRVLSTASSMSDSEHSFAIEDEDIVTASTRSQSCSRDSTTTADTIVRAETARDLTDDIAAAREQGRTEAFATREASIVVAVPQPRSPKPDNGGRNIRKRRGRMAIAVCCCLFALISVIAGYFTLAVEEITAVSVNATGDQGNEDSELVAEVRFDPPTAEDCASISKGTDVINQDDMFAQFVDMYIEITTNSEEDAVLLVTLLKQQIQLRLMPLLIGCDDLVGTAIGNGVVDSVSNYTAPCLFRGNPNCVEVVLTIKIYLRRKDDGTIAVEIMNNLLLGEDLNDALELPSSVETASVTLIVPSPTSVGNTTEAPTWSPSREFPHSISDTPSAIPDSSGPTMEPTIWKPSQTMKPTMSPMHDPAPSLMPVPEPTPSPVLDSGTDLTLRPVIFDTAGPSTNPTLDPTVEPTKIPTMRPTPGLTFLPIPGSTPMPTSIPSTSPTALPSHIPSIGPTRLPTAMPSRIPSSLPSRIPSDTPSFKPSLRPSRGPSDAPSKSPTLMPSILPSMCTSETKVVPLFDEGEGAYKQVSPGAVRSAMQRFACRAGANTDLGIVSFDEAGCTVECLYTIPFSGTEFEKYCSDNPAGGFTFSIPGPFTADTELYIGYVADDFYMGCRGQLPVLNFDSDAIGCFADAQQRAMVGTDRLVLSNTMTVQQCLSRCLAAGFSYAGLEGRRDCFCGNDYMRYGRIEDSRCNKNCPADGMPCGGDWAMSVYPTGFDGHEGEYTPVPSAAPVGNLGCWEADPSMIQITLNPVWVGRCIDKCTSLGKTYAGLHNRNICYCGDAYQGGGEAFTCDKDCAGPCGGADSWTIYDTAAWSQETFV